MSTVPPAKRPTCGNCKRPARNCICRLVAPVSNIIEILILQHQEEASNSKNTAGLLHLCLQNSQLRVGESFDPTQLESWLFSGSKQPLLLYPDLPEFKALGLAPPQPFPSPNEFSCNQLRLVLIDATWRKSRKMLYLNPALQSLPRLVLANVPTSIYKIRKAHNKNQLSTLEASCYALQQLEQRQVDYAPVMAAMSRFVMQQSAFVPL